MNLLNRIHAHLLLGAAAMMSMVPGGIRRNRPPLVGRASLAKCQTSRGQRSRWCIIKGLAVTGSVPVYLIWYGSWTSTQQAIITNFINNLSGSAWLDITKAYPNGMGVGFSAELMVPAQVNTSGTISQVS